jgi:hypothetical protein
MQIDKIKNSKICLHVDEDLILLDQGSLQCKIVLSIQNFLVLIYILEVLIKELNLNFKTLYQWALLHLIAVKNLFTLNLS